MEWARLSDAELLPLVREEGESSRDALRELERRHFHAVRSFAAVCTVSSSAAEELAGSAWRRAMALRADAPVGAVRPHALCSVLRTTADWAGTAKRGELHEELVSWIQSYVSEGRGDSSADDFPRTSMAARAFGSLPEHTQTVLWHYAVEYDGVARIDQLLGGGTDEVSVLGRRARRDFYNAYVRIHQDEIRESECSRLQRTVLAYADQKSIETAADLMPHLERCALCSQAVDDLGLMHVHCGALLAEALLPWGGPEYAASSLPSPSGTVRAAHEADEAVPETAGAGAGADRGDRSYERRLADGLRGLIFRWSGGSGSGRFLGGLLGAAGADPRPGDGRRRHRTKRVLQSGALVVLCSLLVALVYTGAFRPGSPQSSASPPARGGSQAPGRLPEPSATTATATATSTVTATETAPPRGSDGEPPGDGGRPPTPAPALDTALEWLFDSVQGSTTADSSANGILGNLFGNPLPSLVNGALQFNGTQDVSSEGAVLDTDSSFSVAVRVKLQDKSNTQTVVSQDGYDVSGFSLQYDAAQDRWSMSLRGDDSAEEGADAALSDSPAQAGRWTHLTGVYDDPRNEIRLYVDGRLEDTARRDGNWQADGDFAVGRGLLDGAPFFGLKGTVDEVRAFDSALSGQQALALANRS